MGLGLRKFGKAVLVICTGLLLTACAEDFGPDQHGRKVTADSLDGQWLIINYWAEWCAPCRTEIPELNALEETLKNQSARVIGVNFDALQGDDLKRAADSFDIRRSALTHGIPHYTTAAGARAAVHAIAALKAGTLDVAPLQAYFATSF